MPQTIARFQLLELIGRGASGELHRARDLHLGRTVAVRRVERSIADDPDARERLFEAARAAAAASHPSLAAVYECDVSEDDTYIASEFVPGQRLSAIINGAPLNARRALDIAAQVADGLATAHAHHLTHGALDAEAVIVTPKGAVKVLDTGLLAWTRHASGPPSDDFTALGALLFEMMAGRPLKVGWPGELRLPQIPAGVRDVLERLTLPHARGRFDSMATVAATLRALAEARDDETAAVPLPARASEGATRSAWALVLVVLAAALVATWWLASR